MRTGRRQSSCNPVHRLQVWTGASSLLQCLYGTGDTGQSLLHRRAWACDVHAREAFAARTKDATLVQTYFCFLAQEVRELMDVHAESTEVEPHQIRPLNGHDLDLWHVVLHTVSYTHLTLPTIY